MNEVYLALLIQFAVFAVVALGLDFIVGYTKIFSVNQGLMLALGAFSYSFCVKTLGTTSLITAWAIGIAAACLVSLLIGVISLRVRGDYFVVISFGVQIIGMQAIFNSSSISGGASGAFGLPLPSIFGWTPSSLSQMAILAVIITVALYLATALLVRSPWGRLLRAVGDEESAVEAAGFNVRRMKLVAFVLGGTFAAIAGPLFVGSIGVAQVGDYSLGLSVSLLAMVVMGGAGRLAGGLVGALIFVGVPYVLTYTHLPLTTAAFLQQAIFGALLLLVVLTMPSGLTGGIALGWKNMARRRASHVGTDTAASDDSGRLPTGAQR